MSKVLWFSVALLLCSALAEALTCLVCENYLLETSKCIKEDRPKVCVAKPDQPCHVIKHFVGEKLKAVFLQGCLDPEWPCNMNGSIEAGTTNQSICCDDRDLCNTE